MLLRRVTKYVIDQNWFAILINFLIVVVGVFIGIQVANWNELQQENVEFKYAVERLQDEMSANISTLNEMEKGLKPRLLNVRKSIDVLRSCEDSPENQAIISTGLNHIDGSIGIYINRNSLNEMTETPHLSAQLSKQMKQGLEKLKFTIGYLLVEANFSEDAPLRDFVSHNPIVRQGELKEKISNFNGIEIADMERSLYIDIPASQACKNTDLLNSFYTWEKWQQQQHSNIKVMRGAIEASASEIRNLKL